MADLPEQASETDFTAVESASRPADWVPKILGVGLLLFLILLLAIVALAFLGPTVGNGYSGFGSNL